MARSKDALGTDAPRIGGRQYDVMLAKVHADDDTKDAAWVQYNGVGALETAYDAL